MKVKDGVKAGRIKIMGYWDKEPIWRWVTAQEQLLEELAKFKKPFPIKIKINGDKNDNV